MEGISGKKLALYIICAALLYGGYEAYRYLFLGYKTENVYSFQVARVYSTVGLLIRDEVPLKSVPEGEIFYTMEEGGKILSSSAVALSYNENELSMEEVTALNDELEILKKLQDTANKQSVTPLANLSDNILAYQRDLTMNASLGTVKYVEDTRLKLLENITHKQVVVGNVTSFDSRISEINSILVNKPYATTIYAGNSGNFSRYSDGVEGDITTAIVDSLDLYTLEYLLDQDYVFNSNTLGKVVKDYHWYYATVIDHSDIDIFPQYTSVEMIFTGSDQRSIKAWVDSVEPYESEDKAVLILKSDDISADTVGRRVATVNLSFNDYRGLRFSKDALRIVDGVKGVYIKGTSSIMFREVDIIYTGEDFYLSRMYFDSGTHLNLFDNVIVEGANMYHGKPLD